MQQRTWFGDEDEDEDEGEDVNVEKLNEILFCTEERVATVTKLS